MSCPVPVPVMSSDKHYCVRCSPYGIPYGEPGAQCERCGTPLLMTDEQVAISRLIRTQVTKAKARAERELTL